MQDAPDPATPVVRDAVAPGPEADDPGDIGGSMGEEEAMVTVRFDERDGGMDQLQRLDEVLAQP